MRIAYVSYEYPPDSSHGGIATYVAQAARMMHARGHSIEVFAASPSRSETAHRDGIVEHWIGEWDRDRFRHAAADAFSRRHSFEPFDVVEGPEYFADADEIARRFPAVPLVVKMHTPWVMIAMMNHATTVKQRARYAFWEKVFFGDPLPPILVRRLRDRMRSTEENSDPLVRLERMHALKATLVAPPCADLCAVATNYWGVPSDRVRLAPHPYVPAAPFLNLPVSCASQIVGFVGRLEQRKGIEVFTEAIPAIARACPRAIFRFVGASMSHSSGAPYIDWVRRQLPALHSRLEFVGKVPLDQMHKAYGEMAVCVFPSLWENFPNVCLEAMAAGRAIVASSGGGMREMVEDRVSGLLVRPRSPRALAQAVTRLLDCESLRFRLGSAARERVLDAFNAHVIGKNMEAIYREAITLERPRL